ncbi:hypothetical protein BZA70DRAFT_280422 [Myxozyma melibiosi]|uniref:Uncharacterized protein n=1 Tax=Myxozyma melibiosi TaxID=54550 RepID=A0ABR1F379_9ASCO
MIMNSCIFLYFLQLVTIICYDSTYSLPFLLFYNNNLFSFIILHAAMSSRNKPNSIYNLLLFSIIHYSAIVSFP